MKTHKFITLLLLLVDVGSFAQFNNVAITSNNADQNEVTISVSTLNPNNIMTAWNELRSESYSKPGYAFSTDKGITWIEGPFLLPPPDRPTYKYGADPSVSYDRYGNAFYTYVATPSISLGAIYTAKTTNTGTNWTYIQVSSLATSQDKPFMAIDNTGGLKDGRIYVSWTDLSTLGGSIKFSYSSNNGSSFSTPVALSSEPVNPIVIPYSIPKSVNDTTSDYLAISFTGSMPAVAPNGDLYVIWMHVNEGYNASSYEIRKSTDGGITFGSTITPTHFTLVGPSIGRAKIWNLPSLVTDPITNNLYVTYVDQVSEYDDNLRIKFIRSTNGGGLWSTPSTIGNFGVGWQFYPWTAVDENGHISVFFLHSSDLNIVDSYITESYDNGDNFLPPVRVSTQSFNPSDGTWSYDYQGAICSGDNTYCVWTDHRAGNEDPYFSLVGDAHYLAMNNFSLNNDATAHNNNHILERGYYGKLHEVFSSDGEIFYRRSSDNGDSWEITQRITSGNASNNHPSIVAAGQESDDYLCLVWQRKINNTQYEIYTSFSSNSGTRWLEPFSPINVTVSYSQSNEGSGPGTTPVVASYQSVGQKFLVIYAVSTGLYYRTASFGNDWSAATLVPGSYGLNSSIWYPSIATYNNQSTQINLIYDDRYTHVYSQIFNGTSWTSRVIVDWIGSYNRTSSIAVDNTNKTLGVWSGWNGDNFAIRFRQGYSDGTWGRWCKEWSPSQDGINYLNPSVTYYKKDLPNPYGIDILWSTSANEIRQKTYTGLGDTWIPADPNTQLIANSGKFANLTRERENTTKPVQIWTDQSTPPIFSILYNSEYLPKENSLVAGEIYRAAEITNDIDNSYLRVELSEPIIKLTNGEEIKINFKSYDYSEPIELSTENIFDYLQTEFINIPNNAQSLTFKVEINASQADTLSDGTLNNNNQTPFRTINFSLIARDSSHILINNIGSHLLSNLSGIHHYENEFTVNASVLRRRNLRMLPNISLSGTFNQNNLHFTLVNVSIEGDGIGKDTPETDENKILPTEFSLEQNYPNPFNPITQIDFSLVKDGVVTLKIFDVLGKEVATLINEEKNAGMYSVKFDASYLSSGIYFYQLKTKDYLNTKKMILLK